jgi:hypothetical protein
MARKFQRHLGKRKLILSLDSLSLPSLISSQTPMSVLQLLLTLGYNLMEYEL